MKLITYAALHAINAGWNAAVKSESENGEWNKYTSLERADVIASHSVAVAAAIIKEVGDDPDEIVVLGLATSDMEYDPGSEIIVSAESEPNHFGIDMEHPGTDWTAILLDPSLEQSQLVTVLQLRQRAYNGDRMAAETLHVMVTEKAKAMAAGPSVPSSKNPGPPDVQPG